MHCPPSALPLVVRGLAPCHDASRRTTRSSRKAAVNSAVHDNELAYKIACRRHERSTKIKGSLAALNLKPRLHRSVNHAEVRVWPRHANQDKGLLIAQADQQPRHDIEYTKSRRPELLLTDGEDHHGARVSSRYLIRRSICICQLQVPARLPAWRYAEAWGAAVAIGRCCCWGLSVP